MTWDIVNSLDEKFATIHEQIDRVNEALDSIGNSHNSSSRRSSDSGNTSSSPQRLSMTEEVEDSVADVFEDGRKSP